MQQHHLWFKGRGGALCSMVKKKGVIMEQNCVLPPVGERGHKHRVRVIQGGGGGGGCILFYENPVKLHRMYRLCQWAEILSTSRTPRGPSTHFWRLQTFFSSKLSYRIWAELRRLLPPGEGVSKVEARLTCGAWEWLKGGVKRGKRRRGVG